MSMMPSICVTVSVDEFVEHATLYLTVEEMEEVKERIRTHTYEVDGVIVEDRLPDKDVPHMLADTILRTGLTSEVKGVCDFLYDINKVRRQV